MGSSFSLPQTQRHKSWSSGRPPRSSRKILWWRVRPQDPLQQGWLQEVPRWYQDMGLRWIQRHSPIQVMNLGWTHGHSPIQDMNLGWTHGHSPTQDTGLSCTHWSRTDHLGLRWNVRAPWFSVSLFVLFFPSYLLAKQRGKKSPMGMKHRSDYCG